MSAAELAGLRDTIQRLAAASVPLGKAMDYVAQDSEDMRGELAAWRAEAAKQAEGLERALRESGEALAPLRRALGDAEEKVREQARRVAAARAAVARNDARIGDVLRAAAGVGARR